MSNDILFYHTNGRPAARYCADSTVYEECLHDGRFIGLYWSATGQVQRENLVDLLPGSQRGHSYHPMYVPLNSFRLEIDGQSLHHQWEHAGSETRAVKDGVTEAVVRLSHKVRPVTLNIVTRLDGSSAICRYLEITNVSDKPAALSGLSVFSGILWDQPINQPFDTAKKSVFSVGYMKSVDWGQEGDFVWKPLERDIFKVERIYRDKFSSPYWIAKNEVTGNAFVIAFAWSGDYFAEFSANNPNGIFSISIGPAGVAPFRVISPGETVTSPTVHIMPIHSDTQNTVKSWHKHLRASVIPKRPADKEMYTIAGRVIEEPGDWILKEIDIAGQMGVEAFMVDAGWYGKEFGSWMTNRGDWFEGDFLPKGGLKAIRKYAHQKGMLFGLWMEPECLSPDSQTFAKHPEWQLSSDGVNHGPASALIDLSNPEAQAYVEESVRRLFNDIGLDFYKMDYNHRQPHAVNLRDGYLEREEWRHYEFMYGLYDKLAAEFPGIARENCSAGGGRNDLGMLSRFHYACVSDLSTFPYSIRAINAMTMFIPPENLCYYHNHITDAHLLADIETHLRVTLFVQPIYVGFGAQNAAEGLLADRTRRYIELHKNFCKKILAKTPDVYHHTPFIGLLEPTEFCVLEYALPDKSAGYAGVFRLGEYTNEEGYRLRPGGIDRSKTYAVTYDNSNETVIVRGQELSETGLYIKIERSNTSELIMYREACEGVF